MALQDLDHAAAGRRRRRPCPSASRSRGHRPPAPPGTRGRQQQPAGPSAARPTPSAPPPAPPLGPPSAARTQPARPRARRVGARPCVRPGRGAPGLSRHTQICSHGHCRPGPALPSRAASWSSATLRPSTGTPTMPMASKSGCCPMRAFSAAPSMSTWRTFRAPRPCSSSAAARPAWRLSCTPMAGPMCWLST